MSWAKCIIGILATFIFYLFVAGNISKMIIPVGLVNNVYARYGVDSLITAIFFIVLIIAFGQRYRIGSTFKSFCNGILIGAPTLIVSIVAFIVSLVKGYRDFGGPALDKPSIIIYAVALFLGAGICEEFMTRAITMNFLRSAMGNTKKGTILAIIISSVAFGLLHLINLSAGDVIGTMGQVLYAIGFGIILGAVYVRSNNIWANAVLHFLIDISLLMYGVIFRGQGYLISELFGYSHVLLKSFGVFALTAGIGVFLLRGNKLGDEN